MKIIKLLLIASLLTLPANAFWFKPIIEIEHDVSDRDAVLAMLAGKKYRIKFYNVTCPDCKTILKARENIADSINIRTKIKKVGSSSLSTHHVIEVSRHAPISEGTLTLSAIHGTYSRDIIVNINSVEACEK